MFSIITQRVNDFMTGWHFLTNLLVLFYCTTTFTVMACLLKILLFVFMAISLCSSFEFESDCNTSVDRGERHEELPWEKGVRFHWDQRSYSHLNSFSISFCYISSFCCLYRFFPSAVWFQYTRNINIYEHDNFNVKCVRRFHNEELHSLYRSPNIVRVINLEDWDGPGI